MPSYSGVWNLVAVYQAVGADAWSNDNTRALFAAGYNTGYSNVIDYTTIKTTGNATDFGDLTEVLQGNSGCSNSTRGLFASGAQSGNFGPISNTISYITIASTGNATDFGDLTLEIWETAACSSSTRGVFAGGQTTLSLSSQNNTIGYVTISSTGNATDFGDLTQKTAMGIAGCSNGHGGL